MSIDFEGKKVEPVNGVYRCPFRCGDKRFPQPTWKTESGFRQHMTRCSKRPSYIEKVNREEAERTARALAEKEHALSICPYKIGDTVHCVIEIIDKPTHDERGRRVRYEPVKRFVASTETIKTIDFDGWYRFNSRFSAKDIFSSLAEAEQRAEERATGWREHVEFSEFCR